MREDLELHPRSRFLWIVYWATLLVSFILGLGIPWLAEQFKDVFESFGADLPRITLLVIKWRYLWYLLPFVAVVLLTSLAKRHHYTVQCEARYRSRLWWLWLAMLGGVLFGSMVCILRSLERWG